ASPEAAKAQRAIAILAAAPDQAIPWLAARLLPASEEEQRRRKQQIADLDDSSFAVREQSSRQLAQGGVEAEAALLLALKEGASVEVRKRIEALLDLPQIVRTPEGLRRLRGVQVLEHIGTPEAKQLLEALANGTPEAWLTKE